MLGDGDLRPSTGGAIAAVWRKSAQAPVATNAPVVCLYSQGANAEHWEHVQVLTTCLGSVVSTGQSPEQVVINLGVVLDEEKMMAIPRQQRRISWNIPLLVELVLQRVPVTGAESSFA